MVLHTSENLHTFSQNANVNPVSSTALFIMSFIGTSFVKLFIKELFINTSIVDTLLPYMPHNIIFIFFGVVTLLESPWDTVMASQLLDTTSHCWQASKSKVECQRVVAVDDTCQYIILISYHNILCCFLTYKHYIMMNTEQQNLPPQHSHLHHTGEQSSWIIDNDVPPHHCQPHCICEALQTINNDNLLPQHCCPHQPHRVDGMNFVIGLITDLGPH